MYGVIFQVIGVSSWAEVKHIRISSSRIFCSKFFLRTACKQFLEQTRKKFYIESLSPEEKLSNEQFSLKFTIFSNKTYLIISLSKYTASQERIKLGEGGYKQQRWIRKDLQSTVELSVPLCLYGVLLDKIHSTSPTSKCTQRLNRRESSWSFINLEIEDQYCISCCCPKAVGCFVSVSKWASCGPLKKLQIYTTTQCTYQRG